MIQSIKSEMYDRNEYDLSMSGLHRGGMRWLVPSMDTPPVPVPGPPPAAGNMWQAAAASEHPVSAVMQVINLLTRVVTVLF